MLACLTVKLFSFSGIYRELCIESVKNKYDCEIQAAFQHWEVSIVVGKSTYHSSTHVRLQTSDVKLIYLYGLIDYHL